MECYKKYYKPSEDEYVPIDSLPNWFKPLAYHVLRRAILDLNNKKNQILREDAKKWIENEESDYAFSFVNICQIFNINPQLAWIKIKTGIKLPNVFLSFSNKTHKGGIKSHAG